MTKVLDQMAYKSIDDLGSLGKVRSGDKANLNHKCEVSVAGELSIQEVY